MTLTAARVRVDFNPPYSGRKVRGKFKVLEKIDAPAEQARAIVELQYGRSSEFHIEIHDTTLTLRIPDRSKFDIGWMASKPRVIDRLRSTLKPHVIRVVEEYVTPVPEKKEAETAPPATPEKTEESVTAPPAEAAEKAPPSKAPRSGGRSHAKTPEAKAAPSEPPKSE